MEAAVNGLDPRLIEAEILRMREREAGPFGAGARAVLFTLVVFRSNPRPPASEALEYLVGKRPARLIVIEASDAGATSASVGGRCFPDALDRGVCLEEITIRRGADALGSDPGIWAPLLIRDLPVLAWVQGRVRPLPPLLTAEAGLVDKLIVDTGSGAALGENPLDALRELSAFRSAARGAAAVSDLSWRKTAPLRVQTARLFEPEKNRPLLRSISGVTLRGCSRAEALLFFLWLAAALDWTPAADLDGFAGAEGRKPAAAGFTGGAGAPIRTEHLPSAEAGDGFSVELAFAGEKRGLSVACGRSGCVSLDGGDGAYRLPPDGEVLLKEVDRTAQDPLFAGVLGKLPA